jgi:hypothetical protein
MPEGAIYNLYSLYLNKMRKKIPHCQNSSKLQQKHRRRGKIDILNTNIQDHSFTCIGTGTSIKCGRDKLIA